jgi:hypothetical protein
MAHSIELGEIRRFEKNHPFFAEMLTFASTQIALSVAHSMINPKPLPVLIMNEGRVSHSVLIRPLELLASVQGGSTNFSIAYHEGKTTGIPDKTKPADYRVPPGAWSMLAQVCVGSAFERIRESIYYSYGNTDDWPRLIDYFRHVRHGCFHGNTFNLEHPKIRSGVTSVIDPQNPPSWRTSILLDDTSVQGQTVFGQRLLSGDVPIMLADIAERLRTDGVLHF